ncbi:MAG: flavodoxin domain-containing protein [Mycobacteriales bacterium]
MRVLVAYGSTRGGTAGLAHLVADALTGHHLRTEVRRAGDVKNVSEYDAVIVGGALYTNRWHPEAVGFVTRHRNELRDLPVWFFSSGPLDDSARSGALAPVPQVNALAREIEIRGHMTFGGLLDKRPSGVMGLFAWGPEGDFRDRGQVAAWVERIADVLGSDQEPTVRVVETVQPAPVDLGANDEELVISFETAVEWPRLVPARASGGLARIKKYLSLEEEESDDGLDLLENAEP